MAIVLSVLRRFTDSDCPFGIFWPLYCVFFVDWLILITPLVSFGHCIVCSSSIYWFSLPLWYLLAIVLSVLRRFTYSARPFGIFWPLYCLFFVDFLIMITPFGIFWPLYCLFFVDFLIMITPLASFGHYIVCSSSIYWFWLPLRYLLTILLCVLRRLTVSDCPFGIFWPLYCLFFVDLLILIAPLVSFGHCIVCSSSIYLFLIAPLVSFGHCIVCSSSIYWFRLPL